MARALAPLTLALLAARARATSTFCTTAPHSAWPVCDATLALDARAADLVSRLALKEKIDLTVTAGNKDSAVGLAPFTWWNEATHGVGHAEATNFALPITTSCSFNRSLWRATGNQIGREARALTNMRAPAGGGGTFWAPVVNIVRDPCVLFC
jgi:beta-glucosidase-like glycosyl hydrolase